MASETGDMHPLKENMEKTLMTFISAPEHTWKHKDNEKNSIVQHKDTDYNHRIPSCHQDQFMKIQSCNMRKSLNGQTCAPVDRFLDPLKCWRLKDLTHSLSSPVEAEQVYAAQALGKLRVTKKFIVDALWASAQVGPEKVRYESIKALALIGCLHKHVILSLVEQLKGCCLTRRMDTLLILCMALKTWIMNPKNKREPIGAKSSLTKVLKLLVKGKNPQDNIALEAALCLGFLDSEIPIVREFLLQCLTQGEMKRKMKILPVLVKIMDMHTLPILKAIMEQILKSHVVKHRLKALNLLKVIGLEKIKNLGMENNIFELLRLKIHEDPLQEVRDAAAEIVEVLKMRPMMLNIVESQLSDHNALVRRAAVISIGVLGIRNQHMFYFLMDMLDLEPNRMVRKELEKLFIALFKKDPWVYEKLQDWTLLVEEESRKERKKIQVLERQKLRKALECQKQPLFGGLGPLLPRKFLKSQKVTAERGKSVFTIPIKGIALASNYPSCIKLFKKECSFPKESMTYWDCPVNRECLKNLASHRVKSSLS